MTSFVVDASIAVKWFVPEIHSESASYFLNDGYELHVPDLVFPEFGNILWKKTRRGELLADEIGEITRALRSVPMEVHSTEPLLESALELALGVGHTVYDGIYVALAIQMNCQLVTADAKLSRILAATPFSDNILGIPTE